MTKKNRTKRVVVAPRKQKPATPFADSGAIAGKALGKLLGIPQASGIGRWLGSGIGAIFGSGDYQMVGQSPQYNVLANGKQIPKFMANERTNVICHREYIGDITSTTNFFNREYTLNPTDHQTFPWLSQIAVNYQQYRFHGMIFEFRPMITDFTSSGQPGVLVFATNYNAAEVAFQSKQEMENSEYAVSVKPTLPLIHAIECDPGETTITRLYTDRDANRDPRLTDLGKTQLATVGNFASGVVLGELWVSYCVEFFKPKLVPEIGGVLTGHSRRGVTSIPAPLGGVQAVVSTDMPSFAVDGTSINWRASAGTKWLVNVQWSGDVAVVLAQLDNPVPNAQLVAGGWTNQITGSSQCYSEEVGNTSRRFSYQGIFTVQSDFTASLSFTSAFTALPTGNTQCDVVLTQIDRAVF